LRELRVVSVFSRLHPLFPQRTILAGLGDFELSRTVSIDLTLTDDLQRAQYQRSHRWGINKLRRGNLHCVKEQDGSYLEDFRRIYYETMRRVNAAQRYFFPPTYFTHLSSALGSRLHLFVCLRDGQAICGGLFVACHGIVQYHLGGTQDDALHLAPMKLLLDEVRLWATGQKLRVLHLGGGVTSCPDDSLFAFKKGFSDRIHEFATWRWVVFPTVYQRLCEAKVRLDERHQSHAAHPHFFPVYRSPTVARAASTADAVPAGPPFETTRGGLQ
jgi:Acetyltransferase (GNAT) domain